MGVGSAKKAMNPNLRSGNADFRRNRVYLFHFEIGSPNAATIMDLLSAIGIKTMERLCESEEEVKQLRY